MSGNLLGRAVSVNTRECLSKALACFLEYDTHVPITMYRIELRKAIHHLTTRVPMIATFDEAI